MFQYKHLLHRMFFNAVMLNHYNIRQLGRENNQGLCLDVGCNDGAWTRALVGSSRSASEIFGVDVVHHRLVAASANGVTSVEADAVSSLPFQDRTFSFVHSNQVIEHVASVDAFMSELYRVTVPGGHVLISTENASSWVNVGAAARLPDVLADKHEFTAGRDRKSVCDSPRGRCRIIKLDSQDNILASRSY